MWAYLCYTTKKFMQQSYTTAILEIDAKAYLGEGALWHPSEKKLYWINIEGRQLHIFDPQTKHNKTFDLPERIGTVVPVKNGGVLIALQNGIHFMNPHTGEITFITNPLTDKAIRFNDGKCDPAGRFWVGSMHLKQITGLASLYRMDTDKSVHKMLDNVTISNGIVWSADKTKMYYIDSPLNTVEVFDYDNASGSIGNRKVAVKIPDGIGGPDGMTIDAEGKLWVALWGGHAVGRFDPHTGELLQKVEVPAPNITSCAFGGDGFDTLFITTATQDMSEADLKKYPLSGGVFSAKPGVKGVPAAFYEGSVGNG